jgi:hypothetical protein
MGEVIFGYAATFPRAGETICIPAAPGRLNERYRKWLLKVRQQNIFSALTPVKLQI